MPSFQFSIRPEMIPFICPLPGHAILRVLPIDLSPSPLLVLPEKYADEEVKRMPVRRAEVVKVNTRRNKYYKTHVDEEELKLMTTGSVVWYYGHADETENEVVIVMHGQIVALEEE